ncbi:MAG TPA: SH3 domain-containing protein [Candidatus Dormibacteraeota bacterium]|nr:SH3 domain-containing protein [Candidatus Dormibacteraeota bacterium]
MVAVLLFVPLAYLLLPGAHSVSSRQASPHLALTSANKPAPDSPQAAAIAAVQAKTGLKYASKCTGTGACLSMTGQTMGQNAAAVVFSTAAKGGRECAAYVVQSSGKWRSLDTACGLPGQVTPLVGHDATVHVPGNCANVRDAANLQAGVVACLHDGATVKVDRGPVYADGLIWWHLSNGWMAHDFLVGP